MGSRLDEIKEELDILDINPTVFARKKILLCRRSFQQKKKLFISLKDGIKQISYHFGCYRQKIGLCRQGIYVWINR